MTLPQYLSIATLVGVYDHVERPILIMLGALIPVGDSLRTTARRT